MAGQQHKYDARALTRQIKEALGLPIDRSVYFSIESTRGEHFANFPVGAVRTLRGITQVRFFADDRKKSVSDGWFNVTNSDRIFIWAIERVKHITTQRMIRK